MPPWFYLLGHPEARLTEDEIDTLKLWAMEQPAGAWAETGADGAGYLPYFSAAADTERAGLAIGCQHVVSAC